MYNFKVQSMTCMSCFHNIEESLQEFDPTIKASADIKTKTVTVESTQTYEKIKEIIEEEAGYPVCEDKPSCCGSKAV